jgi:hypothetical protein
MPAPAHAAHVHHRPPAATDAELAAARWADDGGNQAAPSLSAQVREAEWLRVSAELAGRFAQIAGREDVIVTALPATRSGAPGAFYPTLGVMEIQQGLFGADPATLHPATLGDEDGYPTAWGVLTHEAAHGAHSLWQAPTGTDPYTAESADLLEESRAEHRHLARRPTDRAWLRAATTRLILGEFARDEPGDRHSAARAAGLLLARRDGGILDGDETDAVQQVAEKVLGEDTLTELQRIWTQAHHTGDQDAETMLALGEQWNQAVGNAAGVDVSAEELAEAVGAVIRRVRENDEALAVLGAQITAASQARAAAKAGAAAAAQRSATQAKAVFAPAPNQRGGRNQWSPITGTRPPTGQERAAAGRLARALRAAAYRERIETVTTSPAPPGRLNMRGALARDAQRAAGATPTAEPWVATARRHAPTPPLRVGIAVDVSGSMEEATGPIASAAWILAKAAASTDPDSRTATVAYDARLTAITAPGRTPAHVTDFTAVYGGHDLAGAIDALDGGLQLTRPGAGRLLVIASDGAYRADEATAAAERITRLTTAGCAVLWLAFAPDPRVLPGATLLILTDPATAAEQIGKAAAQAIARTR